MSQNVLSDVTKTPRERYEAWAESYDERTNSFNWSAPEHLLKAIFPYAPPKSYLRVLDVGVGTGQASVPYLEAGACVTGLDVSASMLEQAKAKSPQFHALIEHDFNRPFESAGLLAESFDVLLSSGALHFASNLLQTLSQLRWVLAPGGILAFTYIPPQERTFSNATRPHAPNDVENMLQQLGLRVLQHQSFLAYYDGGDTNDPVYYQLIVAGCTQPRISLPESLLHIDRTACVDRYRLISVASQPLMSGSTTTQWSKDSDNIRKQNQYLVDTLRSQIELGEVEAKHLPLPQITANSSRQGIPQSDILVLMPHPDDESIYAGGTIAALTAARYKVRLVVATDGKAGRGGSSEQLARERTFELHRATEILQIEHLETLGLIDFGKYRNAARTQPITAADTLSRWGLDTTLALIVRQIRKHRPRVLLSLHPQVDPNYSLHGHHLGLGVAALVAFHLAADPEFILSDTPELLPWAVEEHHAMIPEHHIGNNLVRRIEINKERKLKAIQAHQTQQYSTQRLTSFLESGKPQANFETLQILQARCCRNQVTAVSLSSSLPSDRNTDILTNKRDWLSIYNLIRQRNYQRDALADLLNEQAESWGASEEVKANIHKLRDSQTVAVVTGQQVGILGGPVYTLYKALGAIKLAQNLSAQGISAVPVFWMASYDHDLDEVQQVKILNQTSEPEILNLNLFKTNRSVGSTKLGLGVDSLLDRVERLLANLPHSQEVLTVLRNAYQPDTDFATAFAGWLSYLTTHLGLIILDPRKPEFARLTRDTIARELFYGEGTRPVLKRSRQALAAAGRTEVIPTDRDVTQIFYTDDNGVRQRLGRVKGGFVLQQTNLYLTNNTLQNILEQQPERFTPSALLRPLCQDAVLPTIAYVAGPTEQKYFTQLPQVYDWASIPMPAIVARPSFTVIDNETANILNQAGGAVSLLTSSDASSQIGRAGLPVDIRVACDDLKALQQRSFALLELAKANQPVGNATFTLQQDIEKWLVASAPILESWGTKRICKAFNHSQTELSSLNATVAQDLQRSGSPGNPPPTRNISKLAQKLGSLQNTILREGRRQNTPGIVALANISPNNGLQERHLSIAELIAKHGVSIISHLLRISETDTQKKLIAIY